MEGGESVFGEAGYKILKGGFEDSWSRLLIISIRLMETDGPVQEKKLMGFGRTRYFHDQGRNRKEGMKDSRQTRNMQQQKFVYGCCCTAEHY